MTRARGGIECKDEARRMRMSHCIPQSLDGFCTRLVQTLNLISLTKVLPWMGVTPKLLIYGSPIANLSQKMWALFHFGVTTPNSLISVGQNNSIEPTSILIMRSGPC